jgi:thioredoxin reductase (NADPH)
MMTAQIKEITAQEFDDVVLKGDKVVVDFYSTECPPCEALAAKYDALSEIYGDEITFVKIFRQQNRELARELGVSSSPTILFYNKGRLLEERFSGAVKRKDINHVLEGLVPAEKQRELETRIHTQTTVCDVAVLGGGPAGLSAAIYLAQSQARVIIIDPALPGGYVSTTHLVSNYPGFPEAQNGYMLAHNFHRHALEAGVEFRSAVDVDAVDLEHKTVLIDGVEIIKAKRLIIATGSSPRALGLKGEQEYRGNGISYCSTCDAKYYKDRHVIIIGGGNSAVEEALYIARFASKISIIHQFAEFQANKTAVAGLRQLDSVEYYMRHEPREFIRRGNLDMEVVAEDLAGGRRTSIRAAGVFVFAGFTPNLGFIENSFAKDRAGYLLTGEDMQTSVPGVYAAGDVRSKQFRQITTAVADGTIAALSIIRELG